MKLCRRYWNQYGKALPHGFCVCTKHVSLNFTPPRGYPLIRRIDEETAEFPTIA